MKNNHLALSSFNALIICVLLLINSSCEYKKGMPVNASALMDFRTKATSFLKKRPDSALLYADSAIRLAQMQHWNDTIVIAFLRLKAKAFLKKGIFDSVSSNYEKARSLAIFSSNTQVQASIDIQLGSIMLDKGNLHSSEKYLKEAVGILEKGRDTERIYG